MFYKSKKNKSHSTKEETISERFRKEIGDTREFVRSIISSTKREASIMKKME